MKTVTVYFRSEGEYGIKSVSINDVAQSYTIENRYYVLTHNGNTYKFPEASILYVAETVN